MAYTLFENEVASDLHDEPLLIGTFGCYDMIGDRDWSYDYDDNLHWRSLCEFVRDELLPSQQAELDKVDAFWRANPKDFNRAFRMSHGESGKPFPNRKEMEGWIRDENGKIPPIPESHWWWWPIEED